MQNLSGGTRFKCYPGPFSSVSYKYLINELRLVHKQDHIFYYDMTPAEAALFDEDEADTDEP